MQQNVSTLLTTETNE